MKISFNDGILSNIKGLNSQMQQAVKELKHNLLYPGSRPHRIRSIIIQLDFRAEDECLDTFEVTAKVKTKLPETINVRRIRLTTGKDSLFELEDLDRQEA